MGFASRHREPDAEEGSCSRSAAIGGTGISVLRAYFWPLLISLMTVVLVTLPAPAAALCLVHLR